MVYVLATPVTDITLNWLGKLTLELEKGRCYPYPTSDPKEFKTLSQAFWYIRTEAPPHFITVLDHDGSCAGYFYKNCPVKVSKLGELNERVQRVSWVSVDDPSIKDKRWIETFDLVKK